MVLPPHRLAPEASLTGLCRGEAGAAGVASSQGRRTKALPGNTPASVSGDALGSVALDSSWSPTVPLESRFLSLQVWRWDRSASQGQTERSACSPVLNQQRPQRKKVSAVPKALNGDHQRILCRPVLCNKGPRTESVGTRSASGISPNLPQGARSPDSHSLSGRALGSNPE